MAVNSITPLRDRWGQIWTAPWLRRFWLYRFVWAIALHVDALVELALQAVRLRFPSQAPPDGLAFLGRLRGIAQGPNEPIAGYIARLQQWIQLRKRKGSPYALAQMIQGYCSPYPVMVRVYSNNGSCAQRAADGTETFTNGADWIGSQWNWDNDTVDWSRFWVVVYPVSGPWHQDGVWGSSGQWGDGGYWGTSDMTPADANWLQWACSAQGWGAPHAVCQWIILSWNTSELEPNTSGLPNGTWGDWYKIVGGHAVASRLPTCLYIQGVA